MIVFFLIIVGFGFHKKENFIIALFVVYYLQLYVHLGPESPLDER
jgi:hypothetical protein